MALAGVRVDLDNEAVGGHGVGGQVIGAVTSGNSVVIATSESEHVSAEGGDATSLFRLKIDPASINHVSADSAGGEGVGAPIVALPVLFHLVP
jgi:hypothetical protein